MPAIYQGDKKIVDRYVGETLITRAYQGDKLIFDAYSELSGTLPLAVRSRASQILKNYIIYGTASGAGVETENLYDPSKNDNGILNTSDGSVTQNNNYQTTEFIEIPENGLTISGENLQVIGGNQLRFAFYDSNKNFISGAIYDISVAKTFSYSFTKQSRSYIRYSIRFTVINIMLTKGSTAPTTYIPYGYKLPLKVTSNGTTTDYPVYIGDSKLGEEEYVDYESGKVYKRTEQLLDLSLDNWEQGAILNGGSRTNSYTRIRTIGKMKINPNTTYTLKNWDVNEFWIAFHQWESSTSYVSDSGWLSEANTVFTTSPSTTLIEFTVRRVDNQNLQPSAIADSSYFTLTLGSTPPESYIPYIQPTDPPVPFQDIALPQAEVTIDTAEEFKYHSTIKGRINPLHYAYRINPDTAEITYLADNKNFTPAAMGSTTFDYGSWENALFMPRPCMLKSNGKVDYYLDPNDYSKKLDGTASDIADPTYDGNVMLEFPKIWYKFVPTGNDGEGGTFHCSNVKLDDSYECWCNYDANNNEIDHFYVAAYNAVILDNKMRSLSGYALTQENGADTTTGATEISAARANNQNGIDEWYTYLISDHQLLTHLATLMCKHVNHQAKFGRGLDSGSTAAKRAYVTGTLNDKGLFWGDTSTGTQAVKIFGIENFYACVLKRAAGLIGTSTGYSYKLTHGTKDGSTATSFNTNGSGYKTIARTKPANGYVTTMHYEANGFWIPATTGTNRYAVYHWTGNGYVLVGGHSSAGSDCGSWYVALHNGVSVSYWSISSALSCKPKA